MKKYNIIIIQSLFIIGLFFVNKVVAQNVGINTTGATPAATNMLEILQTSSTASSIGLYAKHSGAITGTGYGLWSEKIGASTTNIAGYFTATGATNNYALIVPSGGGWVGLGTSAPSTLFHIDGGTGSTTQTIATITANSLTTGNGLSISSSSFTTGNLLNISSTSTAGNTSALINLARSGTNGASAMTNYGVYCSISNTNATSGANYGGYFSATGADVGIYNVGVRGSTDHIDGDGVVGKNTAASNTGVGSGVYGYSSQNGGAGVWGNGGANSGGVFGTSLDKHVWNSGVYGQNSNNTSGTAWTFDQVTCGVAGYAAGTATFATGIYGYNANSTVDNNCAVFGQDGNICFGALAFTYTPALVQRTLGVYARTNAGADDRGLQAAFDNTANGSWGYIGGIDRGAYAQLDANHFGGIGSADYGVYGVNNATTAGTAYNATKEGVYGETVGGAAYNFGVAGYDAGSTARTGGTFGAYSSTIWGALGYRSSAPASCGAYATAALVTGTGKMMQGSSSEIEGIGGAFYGGVMGGWIRGDVYGMNIKGERYSLYVDGKTYTNNIIAQVSEPSNSSSTKGESERIISYVPSSTTVDVYSKGSNKLTNGSVAVKFDKSFNSLISHNVPVIVTVTPNGECKGVYVTDITESGFTVKELQGGVTNVNFSWIAIGTKRGCENPENPKEIMDTSFDSNMNSVMFNENNLNESAKPIWWDGKKVRFDNLPNDNSSKKVEGNNLSRLK